MGKVALLFLACFALLPPAAAQEVDFDAEMRRYGLVDIRETDPAIRVELKYATDDNFVGRNMYGELRTAYLVPAFAAKVAKACLEDVMDDQVRMGMISEEQAEYTAEQLLSENAKWLYRLQ